MRGLARAVVWIFGTVVALLALTYAAWPWLVSAGAARLSDTLGAEVRVAGVARPGFETLNVQRLDARGDGWQVEVTDLRLTYDVRTLLMERRMDTLMIDEAALVVAPSGTEPSGETAPLDAGVLNLVPLQRAQVNTLTLTLNSANEAPLTLVGAMAFDAGKLDLTMRAPVDQAHSADINVNIDAEGQYVASLDSSLGLSATSVGVFDESLLTATGGLSAQPEAVAFLGGLLGQPLTGSLRSTFTLEWADPLGDTPLALLSLAGTATASGELSLADVQLVFPRLRVSRQAENIVLAVPQIELGLLDQAERLVLDVDATITPQGQFDAQLNLPADDRLSVSGEVYPSLSARGEFFLSAANLAFAGDYLPAALEGTIGGDFTVAQSSPAAALSGSVSMRPRLQLDGDSVRSGSIDVRYDNERLRVALRDLLIRSSLADTPSDLAPINAELDGALLESQRWSASGPVRVGRFVGDADVALSVDQADISWPFRAELDEGLIGTHLGWQEPYDLDTGTVEGAVSAGWRENEVRWRVQAELTQGSAHYDDLFASGIHVGLAVSGKGDAWQAELEPVRVSAIDVGLELSNLTATGALDAHHAELLDIRGSVFGGAMQIDRIKYNLEAQSTAFVVSLADIELSQVVALEGDEISASGVMSGEIPVRVDGEDVTVEGGSLTAVAPGGLIQLSRALSRSAQQPELDFALRALEDFRYDVLEAKVDYDANGDLRGAIQLKGRNPDIENGRPIHYNLNISENVPVLLESLRLQDQVTERLERKVRSRTGQ